MTIVSTAAAFIIAFTGISAAGAQTFEETVELIFGGNSDLIGFSSIPFSELQALFGAAPPTEIIAADAESCVVKLQQLEVPVELYLNNVVLDETEIVNGSQFLFTGEGDIICVKRDTMECSDSVTSRSVQSEDEGARLQEAVRYLYEEFCTPAVRGLF
jgi:hypothetical protein